MSFVAIGALRVKWIHLVDEISENPDKLASADLDLHCF